MHQEEDNWMPLESNPDVINEFIGKMGLKLNQFNFQQMLSIEEWAQEMLPKPVLGIMLCYEVTPVQSDFKKTQEPTLNVEAVPQNIFYMKQYAQNACGTIALFHIILNALNNYPDLVTADSYLAKFKNECTTKNPEEKGKIFQSNKQIKGQHKSASQEGQSQVQSKVDSHFIAFIQKEGSLWELDGMKKCAVNHGPCTPEELANKSCVVIQEFMARDPDNLNFSMIALAKNAA